MLNVVIISNWPHLRVQAIRCILDIPHKIAGIFIPISSYNKFVHKPLNKVIARIPKGYRLFSGFKNRIDLERIELHSIAIENKIKVYEICDINDIEVIQIIEFLKPDIILTFAWPQIFKYRLLTIPKIGCINCHPSLLPYHRGKFPFSSVLLAGETESGITYHYMNNVVDMGAILYQRKIPVKPTDNGRTLREKCSKVAIDSLKEFLNLLENNTIKPILQNPVEGSNSPQLNKSDCVIDWNTETEKIDRKIRALYPWFKSYTYHNLQKIIVMETGRKSEIKWGQAGRIVSVSDAGILVSTKDGTLCLKSFVFEGLTKRETAKYMSETIKPGDRFG